MKPDEITAALRALADYLDKHADAGVQGVAIIVPPEGEAITVCHLGPGPGSEPMPNDTFLKDIDRRMTDFIKAADQNTGGIGMPGMRGR